MDTRSKMFIALLFVALALAVARAQQTPAAQESSTASSTTKSASASVGRGATLLDNGISRTLRHIYTHCVDSPGGSSGGDIFWCLKVQGAKLLGRALKVQNINVFDGLSIVRKAGENERETRTGRAGGGHDLNLSNRDLDQLSTKSLDSLLYERFVRFVQSRQLQVNLPRLLVFGQRNSETLWQQLLGWFSGAWDTSSSSSDGGASEGRDKKKDDKKYLGPFIAAVLLKAGILKMAYHSIAIVAGKALIVGKIALIISAIIGLKKLVSQEGGEKTTYEIVKHPQVQQSHTYSSSHAGEYEGGHEGGGGGGSYHRSMDDEMMMQDKAYHAWVPTKVS